MSSRNSNTFRKAKSKRRRVLQCAMAGLFLLYFAARVLALDPHRTISQYSWERWGSERGFPSGSVTAIAQSSDGYLWIGTDKGLIRFDGLNFEAFNRAVPGNSQIGGVEELESDAKGNLWVILQSTNILRYHDGNFELGRDQAGFGITAVGRRADGSVVFSSLVYGPLSYNGGRLEALLSPAGEGASSKLSSSGEATDELSSHLSWATGVAIHRFSEPNAPVISMAETTDGREWMGTRDKGLFYIVNGKVSAVTNGTPPGGISCLLPLGNNSLWIGTERGVLEWNGTQLTETGVPAPLRDVRVLAMIRDRDANIWVGTSNGLIRVNEDGTSQNVGERKTYGSVTALFEDREGDLWVGGSQGIERLRDSTFVTYSMPGPQSESSGPVYVDQDGRTWFAPIQGGLHWLKGEKSGTVTNDGLSKDVVYSIAGNGNDLWIGRQQGGLTNLRDNDGAITTKTYTQADGLAQDGVYAVCVGHDGSVWAATLSGGVSEYKDHRFTTYTVANGLASNTVTSMAETPDGTMWFGSPNGLSALSEGRWHDYTDHDGLPADSVISLLADPSGTLWIGTASGLAFLRSGRVLVPADEPSSLRDQILGMAEDAEGRLWIATSSHVLSVMRNDRLDNSSRKSEVREYGQEDGLEGTDGVKRDMSAFADSFGRVWISTNRGLSVVDTKRANVTSAPAIVRIDGLTADGKSIGLQGPIGIPSEDRRVVILFSGLSLGVPDRVRYKYMLDGFDKNWSEPVSSREAVFTNLSPGSYRFRVMASNSDGLWNSAESSILFNIQPMFWQTWWFRLSCLIAVCMIIFAALRLRVLQLTKQLNVRFEERLAERTRIAQELHDTLLQGFLSASMHLHVADERLASDSPAKPILGRTLELMGRVVEEGRNAVQGLRQSSRSSQDLEEAFSRIRQEFPVHSEIEFRIIVDGAPRPLRPIIRDEVYLIGHEALSNAFRHSRASEIELELEYGSSDLRVLVRDNGGGIDPQVVQSGRQGHWGLSVMRERAKRIGGTLRVLSREAAGTEIELLVPGQVAFERKAAGRRAKQSPKPGSETSRAAGPNEESEKG